MRLGFAGRLFFLAIAIVAASVLAGSTYVAAVLEGQLLDRIEDDLKVRVSLLQERVALAPAGVSLDALADDLGARAAARVTIIDAGGRVLGDSTVAAEALARLDNHATRPEVLAALRDGRGVSTRPSDTMHVRMMYAAAPFVRDGRTAGVVRVAVPVTEVDEAVGAARHALVLAAGLALLVALICWAIAARRISDTVRALTATARRLSSGDLGARARVGGGGELAELGATLDGLASNLTRAIGELRGERDLLSGVLEAMDEGVLLVGGDGRIALVNRALREMLLLPADVAGRPPIEVIRQAELQGLVEKAQREPAPARGEIEVPGVKPRRLMVHATSLQDQAQGVLIVFVDVTDLRRLETLRRDFVANVSHELRTPVTAIRTAAETLRGGASADPVAGPRFLDVIERNGERLQSLVEDLLDLSRIESRQYKLRPEALEVGQVAALVEEGLRVRASRRNVRMRVELPPGLPRVRADRRALEQVLTNLVENAVKYGGDGCDVVTRASSDGDMVTLSVSDTGPGIEARHLPRVFERFYRVDAGRSRDQGGTGLGLAIVKNLVEAMGGTVGAESAPGKGSTFRVSLPRFIDEPEA